jgi:hypothetical protein
MQVGNKFNSMIGPTLDKIYKMMEFLKLDSFVIPHYNLPLPFQADGDGYRPEKVFRLLNDGMMTYHGWGVLSNNTHRGPITITNIKPPERWIERAYVHLIIDCRVEVKRRTERSVRGKWSDYDKVRDLILKFNGLKEFVE